ncbi:synaptosomal-associated protein 25-A-like [Folsomia candida]|uniref:Synaptosomal-associated protein 25-A n=1 Tax=Folsomia candida TaxID=158441 RepID=A0A226ENP0_FOLCA|nr:synaptosomal-associated protein 25-A-like [Folsomia candida]OXA59275.1 Synaptosomal-associated protein 25-A [Folsomia candida]
MTYPRTRWSLVVYEKEVSDMEKNKLQTSKVTKESVESTRRMLQLVNECEDAGVNTLRMLHTQGEALKRTEGALEDIDADLRDGEKTLKRISFMNKVPLIFLPLYLMLKGEPPPSPLPRMEDQSQRDVQPKNQNQRKPAKQGSSKSMWRSSKGNISLPLEDLPSKHGGLLDKKNDNTDRFFMRITGDEEEDEIESNLNVVSKHLTELKEHAKLMGSTVSTQNYQLDVIHTKAENNESKMIGVSQKTRKLLGDSSDSSISSSPNCLRCVIS